MNRRQVLVGASALAACSPAARAAPFPMRRGVNLGDALEAPNEGDWGYPIKEGHLDAIRDARFGGARLPVRWDAHADTDAPYVMDAAFMARVETADGHALARSLKVQLDCHHYDVAATFHYYEPHDFTHENAEWLRPHALRFGRAWGTDGDTAQARGHKRHAASWARAHDMALQLGEFGVNSTLPLAQRVLWTRIVPKRRSRLGLRGACGTSPARSRSMICANSSSFRSCAMRCLRERPLALEPSSFPGDAQHRSRNPGDRRADAFAPRFRIATASRPE